MYSPVALNQYTWVNRTHKHFKYASRLHDHFKIHFTPKLSPQQHVKYGIWWTFYFHFFSSFLGGPVEPYVESRGTKVSWRPHHTGAITTTCHINIFGYLGARGALISRPGQSWFTSTLSFILIYMSYMFSNLIRTFWVQIKNMKKERFFRGHVGPLHKIQGYRGHQNVSKCRPHHNGDICTTMEDNCKPVFHI